MLANTGPFPGIILNYIIHMECNMTTFSSSPVPLTLNKNSGTKKTKHHYYKSIISLLDIKLH